MANPSATPTPKTTAAPASAPRTPAPAPTPPAPPPPRRRANPPAGRRVVQDYYQDSNTPQTAPFILKKDADPHNFENDTADSSVIWYRKDGSTYAVQTFKNGEPQSRMNIYQDGRLVAQMPRPQDLDESTDPYRSAGDLADGLRLYHSSGHLLYLSQHYANQNGE